MKRYAVLVQEILIHITGVLETVQYASEIGDIFILEYGTFNFRNMTYIYA